MKNIKKYNIYIFISTFTRNIIDVYSVIFLYQKGYSINTIIGIYTMIYFLGIYISNLSIRLGNKIGYKHILIFSTIITSISFYLLNNSQNPYLISLFLSLSMFTYHPVKHYYGINLLKHKNQIGNTLIYTYIASLLSQYFVIKKVNIIYLIIISIIGIIPALFIKKEKEEKIIVSKIINKSTLSFFIFDQFKIVFLLLEPLYLYLISNNFKFVGIFNILLTISSILCIYLLSNRINLNKNYKYLNIAFTIVLLIKINITNHFWLLGLAFLEGIGIKINELVSTMNLYNNKKLITGYLILSEKIFCLVRTIIMGIIYICNINLKHSLYILVIGIFILSFKYQENINQKQNR